MTTQRTQSPLLTTLLLSIALILTCQNGANARKEAIDRHTSKQNLTIVHDMQFLLSIAKLYSGGIDSICGKQTANAIVLYMNTIHNKQEGDTCDPALLITLLPTLVGDVSSGKFLKSHENDVYVKEENAISQSDIESIKNETINKTRAEISRMQNVIENNMKEKNDSIITRYNNDFNAFVTLCILLITLCVTAAITVGLYVNDLINKSRGKTLELARRDLSRDITASKNELLAIAETAHFDVSARIYTMFSAHCINLYKDIDNLTPGTYKYSMYRSYLDIAVSMARYAYVYACDMQKTLEKRNADASDEQKMLMCKAINNYIFYLSQTGRPEDDVTISEAMPKLFEIVAEMRNKPGEWHFQDTLAWANLYLKVNSTMQTQTIIQSLLNRNDIDHQWKVETKERYDFYNRLQLHARPGYADQIILTVP